MPFQQYGTTQVAEIRLTKREVQAVVADYAATLHDPSYDFDRKNPLVLEAEDGGLIVRFVQAAITREQDPRQVQLKSIPAPKEKS